MNIFRMLYSLIKSIQWILKKKLKFKYICYKSSLFLILTFFCERKELYYTSHQKIFLFHLLVIQLNLLQIYLMSDTANYQEISKFDFIVYLSDLVLHILNLHCVKGNCSFIILLDIDTCYLRMVLMKTKYSNS